MFLIIMLGYFLARTRIFQENHADLLISKYLIRVAIPIYMVYSTVSVYSSREVLWNTIQWVPVPFLLVGTGMAAGLIAAKLLHVRDGRQGVFINACGLGNTVFLGIPIASFVLGPASQGFNMTYYMANTIMFWTLGTFSLRKDHDGDIRFFHIGSLKKIFSPCMLGFLLGIVLVFLQIPIPVFLETFMEKISDTSSALGMIFIGAVIQKTMWRPDEFLRDILILLLCKFAAMPLLMLAVLYHLPLPVIAKQAFFILSLMPGMTQLGLMSREYGSDAAFAAAWIALSTVLCIFLLPAQVWVMSMVLV